MNRILTWNEVAKFFSRKAKRYSRYLKSVLQARDEFPDPLPPERVNKNMRRRILIAIYQWIVRNHADESVREIDISRAVAWLLRITYPHHPIFDSLESLRLERDEVFDGLNWVVGDVHFELKPDSRDGAVLVGRNEKSTCYFDPLHVIAPDIDKNERVPFSLRMAARRIVEYMFRVACTVEDNATENDVNDLAIQAAADRLLETVVPLVDEDKD